MGNACCEMKTVKCEYRINNDSISSKEKNAFYTKGNLTYSYDKIKNDDNCSILIKSFSRDTNYIVNYKESEERKRFKNKFRYSYK